MSAETNATAVTVNLKEGLFSIQGSETFVKEHIEDLKSYLKENIGNCKVIQNSVQVPSAIMLPQSPTQECSQNPSSNKYIDNGIYYIDEESNTIQILKNVPGKSNSAKSKNIALILLYAKNSETSNSEIIQHCIDHACYDVGNFSAIFKKKDGNFVRNGNGKSWTLKLTVPGRKTAEELLESMITSDK